jgi:hypothetical protein
MNPRVEIVPAGNTGTVTHWTWRLRNAAGRLIAKAPESFTSKGGCERAISTLATLFEEGKIDGIPDWPSDPQEVQHVRRLDLVDT